MLLCPCRPNCALMTFLPTREGFLYSYVVICAIMLSCAPSSSSAASQAVSMDVQIEAVRGLLGRLLPSHAHIFRLQPASDQQGAFFEVHVHSGAVHVQGTSGAALLAMPWLAACTSTMTLSAAQPCSQ